MQTILISGGTGMVGKALTKALTAKGYQVIILSRHKGQTTGTTSFAKWDVKQQQVDIEALQKADFIIHLAGAGVMEKKWTAAYKKEIISSRADSATLLVNSLKNNPNKVKAVISASAIGWYRPGDAIHTEDEPADTGFLGDTCRLWEAGMQPVTALQKRLVIFRIGIVLSKEGGALKEFIKPIKYGIAAILGNGKQVISWIHINDLCHMMVLAIENENMQGVYNAVAPVPVTNKTLTLTLAKKMKRLFFIPLYVPAFILKLVLGQRSIEILKSSAVSSKKIEVAGFNFTFTRIDAALEDLVNN